MSSGPPVAQFALVDRHGRPTNQHSFSNRHLLVFFGFTHCEIICPRALSTLTAALDTLGDDADLFQPLYITVDPVRDDPVTMRAFLEHEYPCFLGLTGTVSEIDDAKVAFPVFANKVADEHSEDGYVPHSAMTYVFGADQRLLDHWDGSRDLPDVIDRLRSVVASGDERIHRLDPTTEHRN